MKKRKILLLIFSLSILSFSILNPSFFEIPEVYPAFVTSVVDGDTIHIILEGSTYTVRLIGVNSPEIGHPELKINEEPYGRKAKAFTTKHLLGKNVWIELYVQKWDNYGRVLAYIWLAPPSSDSENEIREKMFNAQLLLKGYAQINTIPPNVKYAELFIKFQREARERGEGLLDYVASKWRGKEIYIGNKRTGVFHREDCEFAKKIALYNRVEFSSIEEAIEAGFRKCKICFRESIFPQNQNGYIGNKRSRIFHRTNCRYAIQIAENNRVYFKSREEALNAGYRPCKVCKP